MLSFSSNLQVLHNINMIFTKCLYNLHHLQGMKIKFSSYFQFALSNKNKGVRTDKTKVVLVKRVKRICSSTEEFFHQAIIEKLYWKNFFCPQVILLSINFYSIYSYNIEIVEISFHTYVATKSSTKKKYIIETVKTQQNF